VAGRRRAGGGDHGLIPRADRRRRSGGGGAARCPRRCARNVRRRITARFAALGGDASDATTTRRRGAPSDQTTPLPLDPAFVDNLHDAEPVDALSGELARIWAPFIAIGV
jgi:hypothetical protein